MEIGDLVADYGVDEAVLLDMREEIDCWRDAVGVEATPIIFGKADRDDVIEAILGVLKKNIGFLSKDRLGYTCGNQ